MTGQISDLFRYQGTLYSLCGISEGELFDPWPLMDVERELWGASTACWRGYQATYGLVGSQLVLDELAIALWDRSKEKSTRHPGPPINGVSPTEHRGTPPFFNNHYVGLNYSLEYTGALLLGKRFVTRLYVHQGFQSPWKYRKVIELVFEKGVLTHKSSRSKAMADIRRRTGRGGDASTMPTGAELWEFVMRAHDRSYRSGHAPNKGLEKLDEQLGLGPSREGGDALPHRAGSPAGSGSLPRPIERNLAQPAGVQRLAVEHNVGIRLAAIRELGRNRDRRAMLCLARLLGDRSPSVRVAAALALRSLGWEPATGMPLLICSIAERDWDACSRNREAAGAILVEMLDVSEPSACVLAVEGLAALGAEEYVVPLVLCVERALSSVESLGPGHMWWPSFLGGLDTTVGVCSIGLARICDAVGNALCEIDAAIAGVRCADVAQPVATLQGGAPGLLMRIYASALIRATVAPALEGADPAEFRAVVHALGAAGHRPGVARLAAMAEAGGSYERQAAAILLGRSHDPAALAPLLGLVDDEDLEVCRAALFGLLELGDTRAIPALEPYVDDPDDAVRDLVRHVVDGLAANRDGTE